MVDFGDTVTGNSHAMDSGNRFGDLEVTDPRAMRALAHPVRLAVLERLRRHGAATATQLSPHVGATPSVTSWHLRHLARFGLVRDAEGGTDRRERRWEAVARGSRSGAPPGGPSAVWVPAGETPTPAAGPPPHRPDGTESALEARWAALAGALDTRIVVSPEELAGLRDAVEALLAPYLHRAPGRRPPGSRGVRVTTCTLPEGPGGDGAE